MTVLKDLPEGTLLIGDSGRKGLYSNDNAPIFVMELGDTKAKVLWQGTSRYDAFMNPLIKKERGEGLKENVDYILPENVGMMLPTQKPSEEDTENIFTFGSYMPSYSKFHVNLATLLDDVSDNYTYLKVLSEDKDKIGWKNWEDSAFIGDKVVMVSGLETMGGYYQVTFTKDEYEDIATRANSSSKRNGLPILPKFDPDNPVFEFVDEGAKNKPEFVKEDAKKKPAFKVELEPGTYLNFSRVNMGWQFVAKVSNGYIFPSSGSETGTVKTVFSLPEYNSIKEELESSTDDDFSHRFTLPTFSLDDDQFKIQDNDETSDVDELKDTGDEHHEDAILDAVEDTEPKFRVKISPNLYTEDPESYLNLEKHPGKEAPSGDVLKLNECSSLFMHDSIETNLSYSYLNLKYITAFTLPEYKKIREQALKNPEYGNMHWTLPEYNPNNVRFELVSGDSLPVDSSSTKGTKTLPNSVMVDLKSLELYITDLPEHLDALKQVVDKLVSYLGELDYGYWLFVSMHDLKGVLNDSHEDDYEDIRDRVHQIIAMAHEEL